MVITQSLLWADWRHSLRSDDLEKIMGTLKGGFLALVQQPPAETILRIHAGDLLDLGYTPTDVLLAVRALRLAPVPDNQRRHPPLAGEIHNYLSPEHKVEDRAEEGTQKCLGAMPKFGYMQADAARKYLGETIWSVIARQGGWTHLCASTMEGCTTFRAQMRKSLIAAYRAEDQAVKRSQLVAKETAAHLDLAKTRHQVEANQKDVLSLVAGLKQKKAMF